VVKPQNVSAKTEEYLEAILKISRNKGAARVKDISETVGVASSTVSGALRGLASKGFINYDPYDIITLAPAGEEIAQRIIHRNELLRRFMLNILNLPASVADKDACRLEHGISTETADRLSALIEFIETSPEAGPDWIGKFRRYCGRQKA